MNILIVGLSHKTAPVSLREKVAAHLDDLDSELAQLVGLPPLAEAVILSTCNRLEIYAACDDLDRGEAVIQEWLCRRHGLDPAQLVDHLYHYRQERAVEHGLMVASSLDSLVVGEAQILGQMKDAFSEASRAGSAGTILNKLFHRFFRVAKRVRTETGIARNPVSIASVAVNLARRIFGRLEGHTCLLIGAGEMCELAAQHLFSQGVKILVVNRTPENARKLASSFAGEGYGLDQLSAQLQRADIVLSSTGSARLMVEAPMVLEALKARRQRPQFYIDIAVPRDLDPAIADVDNAFLYDIDDLSKIVEDNKGGRKQEMERARQIIVAEVRPFIQWTQSLGVVPTVVALREQLEGIRDQELDKLLRGWPEIGDEEQRRITGFARGLVNKILHGPMTQLRHMAAHEESDLYVDALRKLFELDRN